MRATTPRMNSTLHSRQCSCREPHPVLGRRQPTTSKSFAFVAWHYAPDGPTRCRCLSLGRRYLSQQKKEMNSWSDRGESRKLRQSAIALLALSPTR